MTRAQLRPVTGLAFLTLAALLVSACSLGLGAGPAPDLYFLTPKSTFDEDVPKVDWQLVVEEPSAAKGIDTDRIAIATSALELKYLAGVRWADRAPRMVQELMIQSFENSDRIVSVGRQSLGLRSDFVLKSELREFQAEMQKDNKSTKIRVRMNLKLVRPVQGMIVASETIERTFDAPSDAVTDIVPAFDEALGKVLKQAIGWSLKEGVKNYQKRPFGQ